jgi:hypothetical protein
MLCLLASSRYLRLRSTSRNWVSLFRPDRLWKRFLGALQATAKQIAAGASGVSLNMGAPAAYLKAISNELASSNSRFEDLADLSLGPGHRDVPFSG